MGGFEPITSEELWEQKRNSQPDDSVNIPPYEDMSPQEAAKIEGILEKKVGIMDVDEERLYEVSQQIADKGGVLPSDLKPENGPFLNDQDMMKKDDE